jgi:glutathione S-transferase
MLTLVSHALCPYVQRAAILLTEKGVPFARRDIDLAHKPDWFLKVSPLGKTPVLLVGDQPIFESSVICEYLEDTELPRLHPADPLQRARHRGWMEFASAMLNGIWAFYTAPDEESLRQKSNELAGMLRTVESALGEGPYFAGSTFSVVDAAFAPVFRYFDLFDAIGDFGFFLDTPRVSAWRRNLAERPSVKAAVRADYPQLLRDFIRQRGSALSARLEAVKPSPSSPRRATSATPALACP